MVTRTITKWRAVMFQIADDGENPQLKVENEVVYIAPNDSKAEARKAFKEAGIEVPKNAIIRVRKFGTQKYALPIEKFIELAQPVNDGVE